MTRRRRLDRLTMLLSFDPAVICCVSPPPRCCALDWDLASALRRCGVDVDPGRVLRALEARAWGSCPDPAYFICDCGYPVIYLVCGFPHSPRVYSWVYARDV